MEAGLESMCRKMIKQTNPNSGGSVKPGKQNRAIIQKMGLKKKGIHKTGIMVMKRESKQQAMKGSGKTGNNSA